MSDNAVAVFIDAENNMGTASRRLESLLAIASTYGAVRFRRAYANWRKAGSEEAERGFTHHGFELVHVFHPARGKNSADIHMVVDVMDLLANQPSIGCFVLVTGDSDFAPVFRRLRERDREVIGVGKRGRLSDAVKHFCTRFVYLDDLDDESDTSDSVPSRVMVAQRSARRADAGDLLERVVSGMDGPLNPSVVKSRMCQLDPAFDHAALGFKTFGAFLSSRPDLVRTGHSEHGTPWVESADTVSALTEPADEPAEAPAIEDPTDHYEQMLRKVKWHRVEREVQLAAYRVLDGVHEPVSMGTLKQLLFDEFDEFEATELRRAGNILIKVGLLPICGEQDGVSVREPVHDIDEAQLLDLIDAYMLARLVDRVEVEPEHVLPLLLGPTDSKRVAQLIVEANNLASQHHAQLAARHENDSQQ